MIWRIGGRPYKALRVAYRHKLYALGICTWVLTVGLLVVGIRWNPARPETDKIIAAQPIEVQPAQVLGDSSDLDLLKVSVHTSGSPDPSSGSATQGPKPALSRQTAPVQGPAPATPWQPPTSSQSENIQVGDTQPSVSGGAIESSECSADPSAGSVVTLASSWTVPVGGQTSQESIAISDTGKLIWQALDRTVFMGESPSPSTPVFMVVSSPAGVASGPSIAYHIQALDTAMPGAVVDFSWRIEDVARGICQNVTVQVTVVAPEPAVTAI